VVGWFGAEGVVVVKKDPKQSEHPDIAGVPNLHVMMALRSLKSRAYVDEKFNWLHHYYYLTNEGIEYLRDYLHLPASIFPNTLTKQRPSRPAGAGRGEMGGPRDKGDFERGPYGGDRPRGFGRGRGGPRFDS